ncbi:FAD-dependent oxidoreductase [Aurantibacter sp.]|uniref:NAD(P)/FAD-dependent oxidoreductase n=1 Tax=Aurantibacter sp. TaxID=2807103 RepID=UPI0032638DA5
MNLSYWEYKSWLSNIDFTIIGSGIVGLNCALFLKKKFPKAKILVLEKGFLPQGASTKNAGFACFGSISEILSDIDKTSETEVFQLVKKRVEGIQLLRDNLGDDDIGFENNGGHEIFLNNQQDLFAHCCEYLTCINQLFHPIFKKDAFEIQLNNYNFKGIYYQYITNLFESQIDTGKMMMSLLHKVQQQGVLVLNTISVLDFCDVNGNVSIQTSKFDLISKKLFIATNGFAAELVKEDIEPARAQVLITKPIENLAIKGTFHLDEGYYYFRNIDNRILLGGGRNLDFVTERTTTFGETEIVQQKLECLLKEIILPQTNFEIEQRWSGIMGVGKNKKPIVKSISENVFCGIKMGGMGIAIGSLIGKEMAELLE